MAENLVKYMSNPENKTSLTLESAPWASVRPAGGAGPVQIRWLFRLCWAWLQCTKPKTN